MIKNIMKKCINSACKYLNPQPLDNFGKHKNYRDGFKSKCRKCENESQVNRRRKNRPLWNKRSREYEARPEVRLRRCKQSLIRNYGITLDQKQKMFDDQNGKCFIRSCGYIFPDLAKAYVDHNHKTGKVRKLLCQNCNSAIGHTKEDFNRAIDIAKYIKEDGYPYGP